MNNNLITILKTTMKVIIGIVVLLLLLFGSAGTIYWIEACILIILYFIYVIGSFIWLKKNNPELLNINKILLIGYSIGGLYTYQLSKLFPIKLKTLIVLDPVSPNNRRFKKE